MTPEDMTDIRRLIDKLENYYDFQCEGGPLKNCVEWQQLVLAAVPHASQVTRFEVIDDTGRVLTRRPCTLELSYQDDGRTLKVFVTGAAVPPPPSASPWQPIANAPEATHVLVWLPNYGEFRAIRTGRDWWACDFDGGSICYPSHWMLPHAPPNVGDAVLPPAPPATETP